jgi:hypothetical protein
MEKLKFSLVQMKSEKGEIEKNLRAIEEHVRESSELHCEIICFPEMSITGYINPQKMPESVLTLDSGPIKHILKMSRTYNIIIIAGFVEHNPDGKPFITQIAAKDGEPDLDWEALARPNQTVVIYMGLSMAAPIAARLMAAGRAGSTPALIVENASRADERRLVTTLSGLAEAAATLAGPALLIVGEAMALAQAGDGRALAKTLAREVQA